MKVTYWRHKLNGKLSVITRSELVKYLENQIDLILTDNESNNHIIIVSRSDIIEFFDGMEQKKFEDEIINPIIYEICGKKGLGS